MGNCVDNISFDQDEPKKLTEGRWNFTVSTKRGRVRVQICMALNIVSNENSIFFVRSEGGSKIHEDNGSFHTESTGIHLFELVVFSS